MKNPYKVAFWSGLLMIAVPLILIFVLSPFAFKSLNIFYSLMIINGILMTALGALFAYGFVSLGKKYKNKLLVVMSWISIALLVIFAIVGFFAQDFIYGDNFEIFQKSVDDLSPEEKKEFGKNMLSFLGRLLLFLIPVYLAWTVVFILLGVAFLRLKNKVKYAKITGILDIIGGATLLILVGGYVLMASFILKFVILYEESRKR